MRMQGIHICKSIEFIRDIAVNSVIVYKTVCPNPQLVQL